jgi:hypothetical protein
MIGIPTEVVMEMRVFFDVTLCTLMGQGLGRMCCLICRIARGQYYNEIFN